MLEAQRMQEEVLRQRRNKKQNKNNRNSDDEQDEGDTYNVNTTSNAKNKIAKRNQFSLSRLKKQNSSIDNTKKNNPTTNENA